MTMGMLRVAFFAACRGRDDIGLQAKAFRSQGRKLLAATGCREIIDSNRLAIHIAQVSQALEKAVKSRRLRAKCIEREKAQPRYFLRLCARRNWPSRCRSTEKRYECAPSNRLAPN